jgi:dipeptidyl aminopeptidase/acylaminoacyl peptidase
MKGIEGVRRISLRATLMITLVVWLVAGILFAVPIAAQGSDAPQLTVVTRALNLRDGPGTNYTVLQVLKQGEQASIIGRNAASSWWQVRLNSGTDGWVSGSSALVSVSGNTADVPVVSVPVPAPSAVKAAPAARRGGIIVFQVASGGPIYVVNADGSGLRQLTTGIDPILSPDGKQVAFTRWEGSGRGSLGSVWVINTDGSGEKVVHTGVRQPKSPAWSPDGTRLVINMQQGGTLESFCYCAGRNPTPGECHGDPPKDSNGHPLPCYTDMARPGWGLRLINLSDGTWEDLPRDFVSFTPTWDPVNSWHVVFRGERGLENLDLNRSAKWPLTDDVSDRGPVFSPDGRKIAVNYLQHDHWDIHVMNADGTGRVRLTQTPLDALSPQKAWNNTAPAWSPDGKQIAFLTDRRGRWEIWVMNADGSNQRPLLNLPPGVEIQYHSVDERVMSWR